MSNQSFLCFLNQIEIWKLWKLWKQSKPFGMFGSDQSPMGSIGSTAPDSLINHRSLQPLTSSFFQSGRQMHPASTSWQMALVLRKTTENQTRMKFGWKFLKDARRMAPTSSYIRQILKCHGRLNTTSHIYLIKPGICVVLLPCSPVAGFDCLLHLSFSCAKLT